MPCKTAASCAPHPCRSFCRLHPECPCAAASDPTTLCGSLLDVGAATILSAAPLLRSLDLSGMGHLSSASLLLALAACPALESLRCRGCWRLTKGLAEGRPVRREHPDAWPAHGLGSLDLSHTDTGDEDLGALLPRLPRLASLELNFCERLTDACLDGLPTTLASLGALGCCRLSYASLQLLSGRVQLRSDDTFLDGALGADARLRTCGPDAAAALNQLLGEYGREATE